MGLNIAVGALSSVKDLDEEGAASLREELEKANLALRAAGLPEHREPGELSEQIDFDMYGYSGLHYLRRVAAHLAAGKRLPSPGNEKSADDALLLRYFEEWEQRPGLLSPFRGRKVGFDHLIVHSDAEGFYMPIDFPKVLRYSRGGPALDYLGSSQALCRELEVVAVALSLPLTMDPESDVLWEATQHQGLGEQMWQRYGVESFTCLRLYHAARASVRLKAAVAFG